MTERIFFNPGDSLGTFHDYNEAVKKGQIYKTSQIRNDELVIVKNPDHNEEYAIFYVNDAHKDQDDNLIKHYEVNKKL